VLFVRPFREELQSFKVEPSGVRTTFEEFLGSVVDQSLGPLVALGNPTDRIYPKGAARSYYSDAE
jgi:hypothetical protein